MSDSKPRTRTKPASVHSSRLQLVLLLLAVAALTAAIMVDLRRIPSDVVKEGDIASSTVRAPYPFHYTDERATAAARDRASDEVPPVFRRQPDLATDARAQVKDALQAAAAAVGEVDAERPPSAALVNEVAWRLVADLGVPLSESHARALVRAGDPEGVAEQVHDWLSAALGDAEVVGGRDELASDVRHVQLVNDDDDRVTVQPVDALVPLAEVRRKVEMIALRQKGSAHGDAVEALTLAFLRPTLVYDARATDAARRQAINAVRAEPVPVKRGEILFREGDRLSRTQVLMYSELQQSRQDYSPAVEFGVLFFFLGLLFVTLEGTWRTVFRKHRFGLRELGAVGLLIVLTTLFARLAIEASVGIAGAVGGDAEPGSVLYMAPVAGGAMLVRVLLGVRTSAMFTLAVVTIIGLLMRLDASYVLYFLLTSMVAAAGVDRLRERIAAIRAGLLAASFGAVLLVVVHLVQHVAGDGELSLAATIRPAWSVAFALAGGALSGFLVLALLPVFEAMGFVTDYRMLELASLNHPALRQLMLRAPGTYHHSVVVGTLAEAACEAIGANSLQAKIAAYFHDIGKTAKPQYFVENQRGGLNRHLDLDPLTSAQIIIGHVTEGARMAREHRLPKPIIDNILMHHGTGILQFFHAKAADQAAEGEEVDEAPFRYPGPKPNTREAGVVMLADKVEAATRTIKKPTEDAIRSMISRIISSVMADNQFSECPLTFREIYIVGDVFVRVLMGIYHQRIEYPQTRELSQGGAAPKRPESIRGAPGTITLELEGVGAHRGPPGMFHDELDEDDLAADYESVRNLPHGDS